MRILLVTPMVPDPHGLGAIPVLLHAELQALRARHDVVLVTAVGDERGEAEAAAALVSDGVEARFADRRQPTGERRRWRRRADLAGRWAKGSLPWRTVWFAAPAVQRVLDELTATRAFDVVAVEDSAMAMFRLPPGLPSVLTEHEVRRPRPLSAPPRDPRRLPRWAFSELDWHRWAGFQRAAWSRFHRIQVFGERDRRAIAELHPELAPRLRVNPFANVLPPEPAAPGAEEDASVLFIGNFTHAPNRDGARWLAREIMPTVWASHPEARLRIVGSFAPREVLELAGARVEVLPDVARVEPFLERATVFVAPLRIGGGMRMKVLGAMGSGKAVVTTARGAEGLSAPGGPAPVELGETAEEIAARIADLLAAPARRHALGAAARRFVVEHHSPEAWARRLEAVYEEARRDARVGETGP